MRNQVEPHFAKENAEQSSFVAPRQIRKEAPPRKQPQKVYYRWPAIVALLKIADLSALVIAGAAGYFLRFGEFIPSEREAYLFLYLSSLVVFISLHLSSGYRVRALASLGKQLNALFVGAVGALVTILVATYLSGTIGHYSRIWLVATAVIGSILLVTNRIFVTQFVQRAIRDGNLRERIVLVGANAQASKMVATIDAARGCGIDVLGVFEDRINRPLPALNGRSILGNTDDLLAYVRRNRVDRIVVTLPWMESDRITALLKKLRTVPVRIDLLPNDLVWQFPNVAMERLAGVPVLTIANAKVDEQIGLIKRMEDIVISSCLLLLTSPILLLTAIAIKLDSKGPIIFKQKRHGFNNEVFDVYKFRSMKQADSQASTVVQAIKGDPRVTKVGLFLRKSSIDELPQLFNVLLGTMSIVGPRPHAVQHNHQYAAIITEYFARHNVKPGITGWAQINGLRGETDTDEKMRRRVDYDLHYIEHWSLLFDLKIILMTAIAVWFQDTAY